MAVTLPDERDLGGLPPMSGERPIATADASGLAAGVKTAGVGLENLGSGIADFALNQSRLQYAMAQSQYRVNKAALDDSMTDDTDFATQGQRYQEGLQKIRDNAAATIDAAPMQQRFNADTDADIGLSTLKQNRTAFHGTARVQLATINAQNDVLGQEALEHPEKADANLKTIKANIDAAVAAKYIDPVSAQKYIKQFDEKHAIGAAGLLPPDQRIEALQSPITSKDEFLDRTHLLENSSGNPNKVSATSNAMGDYQFIPQTWLGQIKNHGPANLASQITQDGSGRYNVADPAALKSILDLRGDPALSREMAGHLYDENAAILKNAGVPTTPGNMYLAHFAGANGAIKLYNAAPGTPASDILGSAATSANVSVLAGKTADSVVNWADHKMSGTPVGQGNLVDHIPYDIRQQMIEKAQQQVDASATDNARALTLQKEQAQALSDSTEKEALKDIESDHPKLTAMDIVNNDNYTPAAKIRLSELIKRLAKSDDSKDTKTYGAGFYNLFKGVTAPAGDATRITDPTQLYEHVGESGDLTVAGLKLLTDEINGRKTPDGEAESAMKRQFFANARGQITGTNEGLHMKDPKGDELYLRFMAQAYPAYEAGKKKGLTPAQLLDPKSPDYVGSSIAQFKRNPNQWYSDMVNGSDPAAQTTDPLENFRDATTTLKLTPQEQNLYQRHLTNLQGAGGVDNPDGSRSSLMQATVEHNGKTYNIPTVWDGKILKPADAIKQVEKVGWDKFPAYGSEKEAEDRYQQMHTFMDKDTANVLAARENMTPPALIEAVQTGKMSREAGEAIALKKGWIKKPGKAAAATDEPRVPMSQ